MLVWDLRRLQMPLMDTTSVRPLLVPLVRYLMMNADKKCPFTGDVSIRGRILTGRVVSTKMTRTIIIRRDYLHFIPKYRACLLHNTRPITLWRTFDQVDLKNGTRTWLPTFRPRSVSIWEILLQLVRTWFRDALVM